MLAHHFNDLLEYILCLCELVRGEINVKFVEWVDVNSLVGSILFTCIRCLLF